MTAKVSARGQTVIPAELRRKYGIEPNSRVAFLDLDGEIVLVPVPKDGFRKAKGSLESRVRMQDLWDLRREEREREQKRPA
jgi:AbrB family looped-hinge helix DNA binding protein